MIRKKKKYLHHAIMFKIIIFFFSITAHTVRILNYSTTKKEILNYSLDFICPGKTKT